MRDVSRGGGGAKNTRRISSIMHSHAVWRLCNAEFVPGADSSTGLHVQENGNPTGHSLHH